MALPDIMVPRSLRARQETDRKRQREEAVATILERQRPDSPNKSPLDRAILDMVASQKSQDPFLPAKQFMQEAAASIIAAPDPGSSVADLVSSLSGGGGAIRDAKSMVIPAHRIPGMTLGTIRKAESQLANSTPGDDLARQVYEALGVYKTPTDDVLRAVVSDKGAKIKAVGDTIKSVDPATQTKLSDLLDHDELYKIFPELRDVKVSPRAQFGGGGSGKNGISLGAWVDDETAIQSLLHEVQHVVEADNGMTRGGNPKSFIPNAEAFERSKKTMEGNTRKLAAELVRDYGDFPKLEGANPPRMTADPRYEQWTTSASITEKLNKVAEEAYQKYLRIGGEAEARATATMRKNQDWESYPLDSYDISVDELISSPHDFNH